MNLPSKHLYNAALQLNRGSEARRLTSISHAGIVRDVLRDFSAREATVYVWLVMPDHIHVLFSTRRRLKDLDTFLGRVKRRINQNLVRRDMPKLHWLHGAVNHPVTWPEIAEARDYILHNPVRGGYVQEPSQWPHQETPAPLPGI